VVTVAHIVSNGKEATVTFSDGTKATGKTTKDKYDHDVAFIFVTHPTIEPIPVAERDPSVGEGVEIVTYGGPENRKLRHFYAVIGSIENDVTKYDCDVLSGDSGGGILNVGRKLVGVQAFGYNPIESQKKWDAYRGAGSATCRILRAFLRRVAYGPGGGPPDCGPRGCPAPKKKSPFYPPKVLPPPKQLPPPSIDYDKLAEAILAKINLADLRGVPGPRGPAGPAGSNGQRGPAGPSGTDGTTGSVDLDELAKKIKRMIHGSIRVEIRPIPHK
jgi:hypothetical protein